MSEKLLKKITKDKKVVAIMVIRRKKTDLEGEFFINGNKVEKLMSMDILFQTSQGFRRQLIKDGVFKEERDKAYG